MNCQSRILYLAKITFKTEEKNISQRKRVKQFITRRHTTRNAEGSSFMQKENDSQ